MIGGERMWVGLAALLGFFGVAAGALGAHALGDALTPDDLNTFETAARYQVYHALALLGVAYVSGRGGGGIVEAAGWLFVAGVVLFSGSLYVLALTGVRIMGAVAPFGGASFLAGWAFLFAAALRRRREEK